MKGAIPNKDDNPTEYLAKAMISIELMKEKERIIQDSLKRGVSAAVRDRALGDSGRRASLLFQSIDSGDMSNGDMRDRIIAGMGEHREISPEAFGEGAGLSQQDQDELQRKDARIAELERKARER